MRKEDLKNPCFACITNTSDPEKKYKEMTIARCLLIDDLCAIENQEHLLMNGEEVLEKIAKAELDPSGSIVIRYEMGLPKVALAKKGDAYYRALQQTWVSNTQRALYLLAHRCDTNQIRERKPGERWLVTIKEIVPEGYKGPLDIDNYMVKFVIDGIRYSGILGNVDDHFGNIAYAVTGDYGSNYGAEVTIRKTEKL